MFWGLVLEPFKKYTQKVEQTFHISQAAIDIKFCDSDPVQLVVEYENSNFILATLSRKNNIFQVPLDLIFKTGDEVSFRTIGNGKVHLSGYHVLEDVDSMIMNGEEESEIEELEEITKGKAKRKKPTPNTKVMGKKAKLGETNEYESEDDDEEDEDDDFDEEDDDSEDEEEQNILVEKGKKKKQKSNSSLLSANDDDEDEEEEDEDSDEEKEDDGEEEEEDDCEEEFDFGLIDDSDEFSSMDRSDLKKGKLNKSETKKVAQTPNGMASGSKKKDTPNSKLNKSQKQGTPSKEVKTLKSDNKQKDEKKSSSAESTPQRKNLESSKKEEKSKSPKSPKSPKSEVSSQKRVLEGGVISEEIKLGNGPIAKPGKMANVYYVGYLASTKKEFDSVQGGGGFKFRIGRNEVIKGWDIGINGMKVGGKRKLTIPPHLAYGSKGSPPVIPPNSTLVFTIELKGLS